MREYERPHSTESLLEFMSRVMRIHAFEDMIKLVVRALIKKLLEFEPLEGQVINLHPEYVRVD